MYIQQFIEYLHRIKCSLSIRYCLGLEFKAAYSKLSKVALLLGGPHGITRINETKGFPNWVGTDESIWVRNFENGYYMKPINAIYDF